MSEKWARILFLPLGIVGSIVNAWVFSVLWRWYVVETFHVVPIGIVSAFGLTVIAAVLRGMPKPIESHVVALYQLSDAMLYALTLLFIGWIGYLFM